MSLVDQVAVLVRERAGLQLDAVMRTRLVRALEEARGPSEDDASLLQRLIEPEEIAHMCVYLASRQASATTGGALRVDGGYVDAILP